MRSGVVCAVVVVILMSVVVGVGQARVSSKYEVVQVTGGEVHFTNISDISNSGIVYGGATNQVTHEYGIYRHNIRSGATEFTNQLGYAGDISFNGVVAGTYYMRNGSERYCLWNQDGTITDLPQVTNVSWFDMHLDDSGRFLGEGTLPDTGRSDSISDFIWDPTSGLSIPIQPSNDFFWKVIDLNNSGYYLGTAFRDDLINMELPLQSYLVVRRPPYTYQGAPRINAIWSENGDYIEINKPDGYDDMGCEFINDHNQVVGGIGSGGFDHVFLWDAVSGLVDITAGANGYMYCRDINNRGQVLIEGMLIDGENVTGVQYIWDAEDGLVDIRNLIDPESGWSLASVQGFNDDGWIVSSMWSLDTFERSDVILRPVTTPEPGSILAITVGLVSLAGLASRQRKLH